MNNYDDFSQLLSSYFLKYLPYHTGYSINTISSYRDTFILLFRYHEQVLGKKLLILHSSISPKNTLSHSLSGWRQKKTTVSQAEIRDWQQSMLFLSTF